MNIPTFTHANPFYFSGQFPFHILHAMIPVVSFCFRAVVTLLSLHGWNPQLRCSKRSRKPMTFCTIRTSVKRPQRPISGLFMTSSSQNLKFSLTHSQLVAILLDADGNQSEIGILCGSAGGCRCSLHAIQCKWRGDTHPRYDQFGKQGLNGGGGGGPGGGHNFTFNQADDIFKVPCNLRSS